MQTFLPYPDFEKSAAVLDRNRLNAMRRESKMVLTIIRKTKSGETNRFINQPLLKQWYGYEDALLMYRRAVMLEWQKRGYKNSDEIPQEIDFNVPNWFGDNIYHYQMQVVLCRKAYEHEIKNKPLPSKYDYRLIFQIDKNVYTDISKNTYHYVVSDRYFSKIGF